jgi:hypothetical protein
VFIAIPFIAIFDTVPVWLQILIVAVGIYRLAMWALGMILSVSVYASMLVNLCVTRNQQ